MAKYITLELLEDFATKLANKITNVFVKKETGKGLSSNDYTTTEKQKLSGIAEGANKYTHPSYTAKSSGLYKMTVDATGHVSAVTAVTKSDITALGIPGQDTNTTYTNMSGASASVAGKAGLVPAPSAGKQGAFLRGDGTWADIPEGVSYTEATQSKAGLMSAADKKKLDEIDIVEAATNDIDNIIADIFV